MPSSWPTLPLLVQGSQRDYRLPAVIWASVVSGGRSLPLRVPGCPSIGYISLSLSINVCLKEQQGRVFLQVGHCRYPNAPLMRHFRAVDAETSCLLAIDCAVVLEAAQCLQVFHGQTEPARDVVTHWPRQLRGATIGLRVKAHHAASGPVVSSPVLFDG